MKVVRVQYQVKEEYVEKNKENIKAVMADLQANPIDGMMYSTYYQGDGKFMHLNVMTNPEAGSQLNERELFTSFRMQLKESGPLAPPASEDLEFVGASTAMN